MGSGGGSGASGRTYSMVVGVDFSETGDYALWEAFELARQHSGAAIHAVYVAEGYGPLLELRLDHSTTALSAREVERYLCEYVDQRRLSQPEPVDGSRTHCHVRVGDPDDEIVELAKELQADLLVVGTHARHGVRRFFVESIAEEVVKRCPCPVLVVRPKAYHQASKEH